VATTARVVNATTTAVPARTTVPTTRPTIQPGFGPLIALIGLGIVAFHIVRKR
jgi:PGF-CTERM protein